MHRFVVQCSHVHFEDAKPLRCIWRLGSSNMFACCMMCINYWLRERGHRLQWRVNKKRQAERVVTHGEGAEG